jgi:hypothetical protein
MVPTTAGRESNADALKEQDSRNLACGRSASSANTLL